MNELTERNRRYFLGRAEGGRVCTTRRVARLSESCVRRNQSRFKHWQAIRELLKGRKRQRRPVLAFHPVMADFLKPLGIRG